MIRYQAALVLGITLSMGAVAQERTVEEVSGEMSSIDEKMTAGFLSINQPSYLILSPGDIAFSLQADAPAAGKAVTVYPDGHVIFGPKFDGHNAAAKRFWRAIGKAWPQMMIPPAPKDPKTWHLLTVTRSGSVTLLKDLAKAECAEVLSKVHDMHMGQPIPYSAISGAGTATIITTQAAYIQDAGDIVKAECFE